MLLESCYHEKWRFKMKWEIVNPSDSYTMECDNFKSAAVAITLLGQGAYPLEPIEGTNEAFEVPLFMFGGANDWFMQEFGESIEDAFDDCIKTKLASVIAALRSVDIPDEKKSSMNDIGKKATQIADHLEKEWGKKR
jgi:hypothetical protein